MSCSESTVVCCGIQHNLVQDCVQSNWLIFDQTPEIIYRANEIVSASGTIEESSSTSLMTQVTITFLIAGTPITTLTLTNKQSLAFTVVGFDTITLTGNAPSSAESATGSFCLTPRYQAF